MTDAHELDRRTVLKGTAAMGATASVAGCSSLPIVGGGGGGGGGLSYGDEIEGELTQDDEQDPFRDVEADPYEFSGSSGDSIVITMESEPLDPYLTLTNSDGDKVAENDDSTSLNSRIAVDLPEDDTYTIWASRYAGLMAESFGEEEGPYTLTLDEA